MAKRVIRINKGGTPAGAGGGSELGIKGPKPPVRLGSQPAASEDLGRTQPMKRIVVAAGQQRRRPTGSTAAARQQQGAGQQQQRRPQPQSSGPPLWLIPVGIVGLVIIIVLIFSGAGRRQDPYFQTGTPQYVERETYRREEGPRPMKEWMEKHGETDMAKQRKARMSGRPTTTTRD